MMQRGCENCGADISHRRKDVRFCSKKCSDAPRLSGSLCEYCGVEYPVATNNKKRNRFCSKGCANRTQFLANNPNFKEDYFAEPNLENSYWAGFIAADGYIYVPKKGQRILGIRLKSTDREHLIKLQSSIGAGTLTETTTFSEQYNKEYYGTSYRLSSDKVCFDLLKNFNIGERKSLTLEPPDLSGDLTTAFIAGYIDGDGSYSMGAYSPRLGIVGTEIFLSWILKQYGLKSSIYYTNGTYGVSIYGDNAIGIRRGIHDLNLPLLERKRHRWEELGFDIKNKEKNGFSTRG